MAAPSLPPPVQLPVPLVTQETEVWCWLAVTEMALRYRGDSAAPRQCEIIASASKIPTSLCCNQPYACARTGSMSEIRLALARFGHVSSEFSPPVNFGVLYRVISDGNPVIIDYESGANSSHVVIARGMMFLTAGDRISPMVLVNDPMASRPLWVPYKELRAKWISSITVGPADLK
jgi:hypothetical protein